MTSTLIHAILCCCIYALAFLYSGSRTCTLCGHKTTIFSPLPLPSRPRLVMPLLLLLLLLCCQSRRKTRARLKTRGEVGSTDSRRRQGRSMWSAKIVVAVVAVVAWRPLALGQPTETGAAFVSVAPTTGAATGRGCDAFSGRRRRCHSRHPWMSANDITPANGLTTTSGTVQRGGRSGSHPEPDLFEDFLASVRLRAVVDVVDGAVGCSGSCFFLFALLLLFLLSRQSYTSKYIAMRATPSRFFTIVFTAMYCLFFFLLFLIVIFTFQFNS